MSMVSELKVEKLFCDIDETIKGAWKKMDLAGNKLVLVVNSNRHLLGVVTDGDIRRELLNGEKLDYNIKHLMNQSPKHVIKKENDTYEEIIRKSKELLLEFELGGIPILNNDKEVVDCIFWKDCFRPKPHSIKESNCPVIIMAGGKGTRMAPYTKVIPKPLIPIGSQPMIKHIIGGLYTQGINQFYISVNYKANLIRAFFDADQFKSRIEFLEEGKPLGTAGALNLIKEQLSTTFIVTNCDILTHFNISEVIEFHKKEKSMITTVSSLKQFKIPYGVVDSGVRGKIKKITEKPEIDFLVNIGFYILEPDVLEYIPKDTFFHMTDLMDAVMNDKKAVNSFPISEKSWTDLGQMEDYLKYVSGEEKNEETINHY